MPFGQVFGNLLNLGASKLLSFAAPLALDVGTQFATGLITRELTRAQRNDSDDAFKSLIRAAANAVSPTVAIGQTAVPAGGPATGSAFAPATLTPPSIQPPNRILQTDPNFFPRLSGANFQTSRRPPELFNFDPGISVPQTQNVGFMSEAVKRLGKSLSRGGRNLGPAIRGTASRLNPQRLTATNQIRGMAAATGVAGGVAGDVALDALFPSTAFAPGRLTPFPSQGNPLTIGAGPMPLAPAVTGLPSVGRFQKEPNGCFVQWYFWDGTSGQDPQPIDRSQADCFRKDCIFRLDVFKGKFIKMGSRRMNPINVRAFFRAGRRVDAAERIARKMFAEKRKQKTGSIRRKSRARKK